MKIYVGRIDLWKFRRRSVRVTTSMLVLHWMVSLWCILLWVGAPDAWVHRACLRICMLDGHPLMSTLGMHIRVLETDVFRISLSMDDGLVPEINLLGMRIPMCILGMEMYTLGMHIMRIHGLSVVHLAISAARGALDEVRIMVGHREGEQFSGYRNYIVIYTRKVMAVTSRKCT